MSLPSNCEAGSRVVITIRPDGPLGHRSSRSATSARSSMISAHGRWVCASQETKRAAAASAPSPGLLASTVFAACAKPAMICSRWLAVTQTSTSISFPFHRLWANSTASCVLPVPPWAAGAESVSPPWVSTTACPGATVLARSGPVSGRG